MPTEPYSPEDATSFEVDGDSENEPTIQLPEREALPIEQRNVVGKIPWQLAFNLIDFSYTLEVRVQKGIIMGRGSDEDYEYPHIDLAHYSARDMGVSRRHIGVYAREDCMTVQDLGSRNGTLLNGYRLTPHVEVPLQDGDLLELGRMKLVVMFINPL